MAALTPQVNLRHAIIFLGLYAKIGVIAGAQLRFRQDLRRRTAGDKSPLPQQQYPIGP